MLEEGRELRWAPDAHLVLVGTRVVDVVDELEGLDLAHLGAEAHEGHGEQVVGEAGVDAGGEAGGSAFGARLGDGVDPRGRVELHVGPDPRGHGRRRHVDAGAEEGAHVPDVGVGLTGRGPVVHQGVGAEGDERIQVVRRRDPDWPDAADVAGVAADLVLVVDTDADQLEVGVAQHLGDDHLPHEPRPPDDDPLLVCHGDIIASRPGYRDLPPGSVPPSLG